MKLRRSFLGYISFGIGTLVMSVYLYSLFVSLFEYLEKINGVSVFVFGLDASHFASVFLLALLFAAFFGLSSLFSGLKRIKLKKRTGSIVYWALFLAVSAWLVYSLYQRVFVSENVLPLESVSFCSLLEAFESGIPALLPIKKLYYILCVFLMKTFGKTEMVILVFNTALLFFGLILASFSTYYLFGKTVSLITYITMSFLYSFVDIYDCKGEVFLYFLISFLVFFLSFFIDICSRKKSGLGVIFTSFIVILLPMLVWFLFAGFNMSFFFYKVEDFLYLERPDVWNIVFSVFALFLFLGFLKSDYDRVTVSVLPMIVLFGFLIFGDDTLNFELYSLWIWGILSGLGFETLFIEKRFEIKGKANKEFKKLENSENTLDVLVVESVSEKEVIDSGHKVISVPSELENSTVIHSNELSKEPKKPAFLDNPLPLPKKHVKKSISYAFEPSEDLMKYDLDVSEDDDFDLK